MSRKLKTISSLLLISIAIHFGEPAVAAPKPVSKTAPAVLAKTDPIVQSRPLIAGDIVKSEKLTDYGGKPVELTSLLENKYTVLIYSNPNDLTEAEKVGYFEILYPPLKKLGYQFVVVYSSADERLSKLAEPKDDVILLVDEKHASFEDMGLADIAAKKAPARSGIFLVGPTKTILFEFSSSSRDIPLSSEVLILAARVYKEKDKGNQEKKENDQKLDAKNKTGEAPTANLASPISPLQFPRPDPSIVNLLTYDDIAHADSWWVQVGVGTSIYDVDRNYWSPRWSPGVQVGKRFGRIGYFGNFELDQSFDLTQETKHVEVFHVGPGIEYLFFLGRMRTSLSAGLAILESDTDIDERGKVGWYVDFRPISVRWAAFGGKTAIEMTPFSLDVSVPVTHGIPLVLFAYFTTLSFEWAWDAK